MRLREHHKRVTDDDAEGHCSREGNIEAPRVCHEPKALILVHSHPLSIRQRRRYDDDLLLLSLVIVHSPDPGIATNGQAHKEKHGSY
jgi:hypothetical protein